MRYHRLLGIAAAIAIAPLTGCGDDDGKLLGRFEPKQYVYVETQR